MPSNALLLQADFGTELNSDVAELLRRHAAGSGSGSGALGGLLGVGAAAQPLPHASWHLRVLHQCVLSALWAPPEPAPACPCLPRGPNR